MPSDYQGRNEDYVRRHMLDRYGLDEFAGGGAYGPERILSLFNGMAPSVPQVRAQFYGGPSVSDAMAFGQGAMDLAGRSAAASTRSAMTGLDGLPPAARAAALAQISQGAAGNVGAAGLSGFQTGVGALTQTGLANQSARLSADTTNAGNALSDRMGQLGLFNSALGNAMQVGMYGADAQNQRDMWEMEKRDGRRAERRGRLGKVVGGLGGLAGMALAGPLGGMLGQSLGLGGGAAAMASGGTGSPYGGLSALFGGAGGMMPPNAGWGRFTPNEANPFDWRRQALLGR